MTSVRDTILQAVTEALGQRRFNHWFQGRSQFDVVDDELQVGVANPFLLNFVQSKFKSELADAARGVLGPSARVRFHVLSVPPAAEPAAPEPAPAAPPRGKAALAPTLSLKGTERRTPAPEPARPERSTARRFADLADFVPGPGTALALAAVRQLIQGTSVDFNPLFLHGPVGTGKTHLLEGIYRALRKQQPSLSVMYLTAEGFTNYFTQALRDHAAPSFRARFRTCGVLLLDDAHFLDNKKGVQGEFLHTFQQLASHGRQVVIASDRHPQLLTRVCDELRSRFVSGMVCRLEAPDLETRRKIVAQKAAKLPGEFSEEALEYVATRFTHNVRELEGALHSLQTSYELSRRRISVATARQVLADLERDCLQVVRMSDVETAVCELFGLQAEELKSANRARTMSYPRMLAMYLARKHTRGAYSEIGAHFGGRNHSTVMSAEKKIDGWLETGATIPVASRSLPIADILATLERRLQVG